MSINVMATNNALHSVRYRIFNYLLNGDRQEKVLFSGGNVEDGFWKELATYEKNHQKSKDKNNEARELMIPLPNDLMDQPQEIDKIIKEIVDLTIPNQAYKYAVHQKSKGAVNDNLHVHIVYSERQKKQDLKPKLYKRDIWYDFTAKKMSSKGVGEIIHHKGEIQKDKEGNIVYDSDPFTIKNDYYTTKKFTYEMKWNVAKVLNSRGYDFTVYSSDTPYIHQRKIYKGYSEEKKQETILFNDTAKAYNKEAENLIKLNNSYKQPLIEEKNKLFKENEQPLLTKINNLTQKVKNTIKQLTTKVQEETRKIVYSWIAPLYSLKKNEENDLIAYENYNGFGFDIKVKNGDYEILQTNEENAKIGLKEAPNVEITDKSGPEFMRRTKKGDENLLIQHHQTYSEELEKDNDYSLY